MATIITRSGKGSALTHTEMDANFTNLNNDKPDVIGTPATNNVVTFDANDDVQDGGYSFPNANAAINSSDEELNYSVGVTSLIQTQLDAKMTGSNNLSDISDSTIGRDNLGINDYNNNLFYLGSGEDGAKTVASSEDLASGEYHYTSLTIDAGRTLGITESTGGWLLIRVTGTFTMASSSIIDLNGKGAAGAVVQTTANSDGITGDNGSGGGSGGGGGSTDSTQKGGAGGSSTLRGISIAGGAQSPAGPNGDGNVGAAISSRLKTIIQSQSGGDLYTLSGSGGGSGGIRTGATGGAGGNGGAIIIIIADTIVFPSGAIIQCAGADGGVGVAISGGGGGGGGGVIVLAASTMTNAGTLTTSGGTGGGDGGLSVGAGGNGGAGYSTAVTL